MSRLATAAPPVGEETNRSVRLQPDVETTRSVRLQPDVRAGKALYEQACVVCHDADGKGGHGGGAPLVAITDLQAAIQTVTAGRNAMPPFSAVFTPEQIRDVSGYVVSALNRSAAPGR